MTEVNDVKRRVKASRIYLISAVLLITPFLLWVIFWPKPIDVESATLSTAMIGNRTVLIVDSPRIDEFGTAQSITYGYNRSLRTFWIEVRASWLPIPPLRPSEMNFPVAINPRTVAWENLDGRVGVAVRYGDDYLTMGYVNFQEGQIVRVENVRPMPTEAR